MPAKRNKTTFVVQGRDISTRELNEQLAEELTDILQVEVRDGSAVSLAPDRSGDSSTTELTATDEDVVELTLEDNLQVFTSVGRLREEILTAESHRGAKPDQLVIPRRLTFSNQHSRGEDGLLVEAFKLLDVKGRIIDHVTGKAAEFTARKVAELIEDQLVGDGALFRIHQLDSSGDERSGFQPVQPEEIDNTLPILLFIHGTASSTRGGFSDLWKMSFDDTWDQLKGFYGENILAFEHRTLSQSPIDNAIELLEALPENATLHLVSHSRGGLVGELLCRAQFDESREPFTSEEIALFDADNLFGLAGILQELRDDYAHHRRQLQKLNTLLMEKQPRIERFVRVACPARGTTLASGKLDLYLSGVLNVIGQIPVLKVSPIYGLLKTFTLAVAKERTRPEQLPGLEAQMPGSPLIGLLNSTQVSTHASLAVIEGDINPTGIFKKIAMFFLDQFYESDHDLVVNTPSMDGGARRVARIPVLFDQGRDVNHFQYFSNKRTRRGLLSALTDAASPPTGFQLRKQTQKTVARTLSAERVSGEVSTVFLLPGLTGSHLAVDNNRIWVDPFDLLRGKFTKLKYEASDVSAQQVVGLAYGDLIDFLAATHEVIPFPYDWRRSVMESGLLLAAAVDERLRNTDQPVHIVAHSMGGIVFRAMIAQDPQLWDRLRERTGSRVLMLGTPNRGSYSIPRIFSRQDSTVKMLALADLRHNQDQLLAVLSEFRGMLELLPVDDQGKIPADILWDQFGKALGGDWKRPGKTNLRSAQRTWDKLGSKKLDPERVFYIAGRADETPVAVEVDENQKGKTKIRFFSTSQGDGQVPWNTGIPAGIKHWFVDASHGDIPDHEPAFTGMLEILETGNTQLLSTRPQTARGIEAQREMLPDQIDVYPDEDALTAAFLGRSTATAPRKPVQRPMQVSLVHGNLRFATSPVAVGHYQGDSIVSAEAAVDACLENRLKKRLLLNLYPGPLQTNEVLLRNHQDELPGAIIIGLGEVGTLTSSGLTDTFREAVLRYVLTVQEEGSAKQEEIGLSALLIGTGAGGMSTEDAITAMLRAVLQANQLLAGPANNIERTIQSVRFIELYEDVAVGALHALHQIVKGAEFRNRITARPDIISSDGRLRRVYYDEDPAWWQRLRIESTEDGGLKYTSLAGRARLEMSIQPLQKQSVEPYLQELTGNIWSNSRAGRTLFELLVPREFKTHVRDNQDMVLVVDKGSARYPWELLEYAGFDGDEPLASKVGMVRQLASFESDVGSVCNNHRALVVGDPRLDGSEFVALPAAQKEARAVERLLSKSGFEVKPALIGADGTEILTELMTDDYEILHLAGHGVVDYPLPEDDSICKSQQGKEKPKLITGMVIGKDHYLTPTEIRQMPSTPAFVFINCCHLGSTDTSGRQGNQAFHRLAANLATQLIGQGVKAVIAAGWAVNDDAAQTFAETFYKDFLKGCSFGDAVKQARMETYHKHDRFNTWGAYQCYGDPGYCLTTKAGRRRSSNKQTYVSLAEHVSAIENIAEWAKTASDSDARSWSRKLDSLLLGVPPKWADDANLVETAGRAWGQLGEFSKAIEAYERAISADPASATIQSAEQLANFEAREAVKLNDDGQSVVAKRLVNRATKRIDGLNSKFGTTVERLALKGSAAKHRSIVYLDKDKECRRSLMEMEQAYKASYQLCLSQQGKINTYPLNNWLTAHWLLVKAGMSNDKDLGGDGDFDSLLGQAMQQAHVSESSMGGEYFWNAIAENDCRLLAALKQGDLVENKGKIADTYRHIRKRASSPRQFLSVMQHLGFLERMSNHFKLAEQKPLEWLIDNLNGRG
ncbi:MAG: CHAT domain-containing protein [gamma proteobacterium endosymbiont of Lamellibrachia anaximandri]|nr:CHAT domain-containing protein [gamma proteobacterium endosymbiont of Lamellibrachia anaximandri]